MKLVGITGAIGHGKSTLAKLLATQEPTSRIFESSEVISEVATVLNTYYEQDNPTIGDARSVNKWLSRLPSILFSITGRRVEPLVFKLSDEEITSTSDEYIKLWEYILLVNSRPAMLRELITQTNKSEYRAILQWIGGYCVENITPVLWTTELLRRAKQAKTENCQLAIFGGIRFAEEAKLIQNTKGKIIKIVRPEIADADTSDPTERQRKNIKPDSVISNDLNLKDLKVKSKLLYQDIASDKLKRNY